MTLFVLVKKKMIDDMQQDLKRIRSYRLRRKYTEPWKLEFTDSG